MARRTRGYQARTPAAQVALAVRVLDNMHGRDVYDRAKALGDRQNVVLPLDLSRNTLRSYADRINRAHMRPPLVSGLTAKLALLMGDASATTTIEKYTTAGGRPMPTTQAIASREAGVYWIGAGYAGTEIGWSRRSRRLFLRTIKPDAMNLEYASDDPTEPTVIRVDGEAMIDGDMVDVVTVYDLTDLDTPSMVVYRGSEDVTQKVHRETFTGADYFWRYKDGTPFHPVVVLGNSGNPYSTSALVDATLSVAMRWSAWGTGTDNSSHPQRNVRGLALFGLDSSADNEGHGGTGLATGAETVLQWTDADPQKPGDHWQDAPAFDPETNGRAIRDYETSAMSAMGIPVSHEQTGGEPAAREAEAVAELVAETYAEFRRYDDQILRRCAAVANRLPSSMVPGTSISEEPYGVLYRNEVAVALTDAEPEEGDDNGGPGPGRTDGEDPGGNSGVEDDDG